MDKAQREIGTCPPENEGTSNRGLNDREKSTLFGVDCPACSNTGLIVFTDTNGGRHGRECGCMRERRSLRRLRNSGLSSLVERCTFDSFVCTEPWQEDAKRKAQQYVTEGADAWLLACGNPGTGKTHLCSAICGELIKAGFDLRYMLWRDVSVALKAAVTNDADYAKLMEPLKKTQVLYIDDFFKTERGAKPTTGDINLAFEIINNRYLSGKRTIISTELSPEALLDIDEATGSRIYALSHDYCLRMSGQNHRLI